MTDANTLTPCPHLEPCPWCGCALYAVWRRANPRASCKTEGCFGRKMAVVNLDDPSDVAAWNCRAPAPAPTDAEIDAIADQHKASGYGTVWPHAFARAILAKWGAQPVAAPVGMEPVAWVEVRPGLDGWFLAYNFNPDAQTEPLYSGFQVQAMLTAAHKPLTDRQIGAVIDEVAITSRYGNHHFGRWMDFARAIEQAHGIKATNQESNK